MRAAYSICAISTFVSQPSAKSPENHRRNETQEQADKAKQAIAPSNPKHIVHLWREQREREARHSPNERGRAGSASCIRRVCVNNVRLSTVEAYDKSNGKDAGTNIWDYPVHLPLCGPSV